MEFTKLNLLEHILSKDILPTNRKIAIETYQNKCLELFPQAKEVKKFCTTYITFNKALA